ncbi:homeobox-leucine zipper protein HDG5-like isoform X1 [Cucurbita moschata]|uniref:Homeobox-leucine zipper protein HDG5-like isoform X1 n=1 Tax=Cucurbita moschata TaxID=3662 RepID=A0A6J1ET32_CUCMO|nr:homeobox-leucine zipper protein HDG5-like isoform X1 [Cucurbita moschata]
MYGDCQVMSSNMGANMASSESLFSSPIQNPNFNFISNFHHFPSIVPKEENGLIMRGKEDMESGSGSEQLVEENPGIEMESNDNIMQNQKKKRYHRHTARQIQEMEALFKECPHPDDKQRLKLSQELGLKPRQVKFWFQNRRTQMKAQQDRSDNVILRSENDTLKNENYRLQTALRNIICPSCGGQGILGEPSLDEQQLRLENARLREQLEQVCSFTSRYTGRPLQGMSSTAPPLMQPSLDLDMNIYSRQYTEAMVSSSEMMPLASMLPPDAAHFPEGGLLIEEEKTLAMDLAISSMAELVKMCRLTEPLWIRNSESGKEVLNVEEHARMFPWPMNLKQHLMNEFRTEATRDSAVVIMNSITLVDAFLDANKWMELFPSLVAKAKTVQIISSSVSGHASGSLRLMYAELQALSPLIPTREAHFLRCCQQNADEGSWAIVDLPIDSFHDSLQHSFPRYRRRPSGCIIQDMPNGYSRVTWVEHAEIEEKPIHQIFNNFVHSGMAFGAHRWLAILQRQCERIASLMARNISDLGVIPSPEARQNLMKLAQRMTRTFSLNISTSGGQSWTALSDSPDDTVRITTQKIVEPGQPNGVILSAVSTTWLPYPHYRVFDLLRDERQRSQLEVLSNGNSLHEVAHIANGSHPGNCISLLRINVASNFSQHVELMLQESCTDQSGSLVVFATIDVDSIQLAMSGEDSSSIPLLPIGFSIVPVVDSTADGRLASSPPKDGATNAAVVNSGCLLTVGLQVLASTIPSAKLNLSSVTAINNQLCNTLHQINAALGCSSTQLENANAAVDQNTALPLPTQPPPKQ